MVNILNYKKNMNFVFCLKLSKRMLRKSNINYNGIEYNRMIDFNSWFIDVC